MLDGRPADALQAYDRALADFNALIKLMKDDFKGGLADYDEALKYDARDAYSWNNRAIAKRELGDKDGAIADFKKALEINPTLASAKKALSDLGAAP